MSGRPYATVMNGKRISSVPHRHQTEPSPHHFDLIRYICDSWNSVTRELDVSSNYRNGSSVTYYEECEPNPLLKDFEPFNLEAWWGKRVMQSITRNANS